METTFSFYRISTFNANVWTCKVTFFDEENLERVLETFHVSLHHDSWRKEKQFFPSQLSCWMPRIHNKKPPMSDLESPMRLFFSTFMASNLAQNSSEFGREKTFSPQQNHQPTGTTAPLKDKPFPYHSPPAKSCLCAASSRFRTRYTRPKVPLPMHWRNLAKTCRWQSTSFAIKTNLQIFIDFLHTLFKNTFQNAFSEHFWAKMLEIRFPNSLGWMCLGGMSHVMNSELPERMHFFFQRQHICYAISTKSSLRDPWQVSMARLCECGPPERPSECLDGYFRDAWTAKKDI